MPNSGKSLMMTLGVITSSIAVPIMTPLPSNAICDEPRVIYEFPNRKVSKILTNLRSDWAEGGTTINYTKNTTAQVNASTTATVGAEGGVIFAQASASLGVTVGASWSKSDSWSYTKTVPNGKEGRLVMYRESREFTVVKKSLRTPCNYVTVYSAPTNAPTKTGSNIWRMQLRNPGQRTLNEQYEEVDVAVEENVEGDIQQ